MKSSKLKHYLEARNYESYQGKSTSRQKEKLLGSLLILFVEVYRNLLATNSNSHSLNQLLCFLVHMTLILSTFTSSKLRIYIF